MYVGNEKVLDIYGKRDEMQAGKPYDLVPEKYDASSVTNLFSAGKSVGSIMMAIQRDKNKIAYEDKIGKHWPEFAKNGKEDIMI